MLWNKVDSQSVCLVVLFEADLEGQVLRKRSVFLLAHSHLSGLIVVGKRVPFLLRL